MPDVQTTDFQPLTAKLRGSHHGQDRALQRTLRDGVADALGLSNSRGVHGLAQSIRDQLAKAGAGPDATPSLLETIDRALDDAAGKLAAQGVSREAIEAGVSRFRNQLAREIGELANAGDGPAAAPGTEKTAIATREVVRERFSMDILTAEGDKVSIRFKSLNVTELAAAKVTNASGSAIAFEAHVIARGRFKVEVDGNLNEEERAAIGNLLDKVDDIAADFFGGDVEAAFAAAARVGLDSSALSAFDLRLFHSRSLAAAQTYASNAKLSGEPAKAPTPEPVKLPASKPTVPTHAAPPPGPAPATEVAVPELDGQSVETPDTVPASEGTATTAAAANATAKAVSALETITSFTRDILERLEDDDESDAVKFSLRWKVEFMVKAFGSVALTFAEQKAAEALGIALDGPMPGA